MTRIWTEGFEIGDVLGFTLPGDTVETGIAGMSGQYCYYVTNGSPAYRDTSDASEFYYRVRFQTQQTHVIFQWNNGATVLGSIRTGADNKLTAYVGTTLVATSTMMWQVWTTYLLEVYVKIADSGGRIKVKLDGLDSGIDFTGDTKPSTQTVANRFTMSSGSGVAYYDDIALNDTNGVSDNSWCGPGRIIAVKPNANGDISQLSGSDGNSIDNYSLIDDVPVSSSPDDYVEGSVLNNYDLYNLESVNLSNATISRIWVEGTALDTVAVGGKCSLGIKPNGGAEVWSSDFSLITTASRIKMAEQLVNPVTSQPWTIADINSLQVGFKVR